MFLLSRFVRIQPCAVTFRLLPALESNEYTVDRVINPHTKAVLLLRQADQEGRFHELTGISIGMHKIIPVIVIGILTMEEQRVMISSAVKVFL